MPDHNLCPLIKKPFLVNSLYPDSLFMEKGYEFFQTPFGQLKYNLDIQGIIIKIGFTLMNYRNDISTNFRNGFEGSNQLTGRILHLEFHGNLHTTTCQVVDRLSR